MNETRVFAVDAAQASRLEAELRRDLPPDADWRAGPHARFSVKTGEVMLTCYRSGKVVLQGRGLDRFAGEHLEGLAVAGARADGMPIPFDGPTVGSDETGKGDYFGPLVVAAAYGEPAVLAELKAMGVADSKSLTDARMFPMAERIERTLDCEVRVLDPVPYNQRYRSQPNVNVILAELHAEVIAALLSRHPAATVLVDRFADERLLAGKLVAAGAKVRRLVQMPRAEAHPMVASASIVARIHFLEGIKRCEEAAGTDLHKGAGPPVDKAARRVMQIGGMDLLGKVAKLHFKNTQKIGGAR